MIDINKYTYQKKLSMKKQELFKSNKRRFDEYMKEKRQYIRENPIGDKRIDLKTMKKAQLKAELEEKSKRI